MKKRGREIESVKERVYLWEDRKRVKEKIYIIFLSNFGSFISAYYGAQAICALPAGGLTDRFGIGQTLVFSHVFLYL